MAVPGRRRALALTIRRRTYIGMAVTYVVSAVYLFYALLPIYFMVTNAFRIPVDSFAIPPKFLFFRWTLDNYAALLKRQQLPLIFSNSAIIAVLTTVCSLAIGSLGAYALARFDFRGKRQIAFVVMIMRMLPAVGILLPIYVVYQRIGLVNTRTGLVLLYTVFNLPFLTWFLWSFIQTVPRELEEAALIEGLDRVGTFVRVTIPLMKGGMAAAAVFAFTLSWNEFLFGLVLTDLECRTLPVLTAAFIGQRAVYWGQMCALGTLIAVPVIILTALTQRYIIAGLTLGAIKD